MPVNTKPIFTKRGKLEGPAIALTAANASMDGTGTIHDAFTAGPDGALALRLVARPLGTNVQTVLRIFRHDGAAWHLLDEMTLPATTASSTAAHPPFERLLNLVLPPGRKLGVTLGTAVAAGYEVTVIGGDYAE